MCLPLPILTGILARGAKPPGGFGMVVPQFTTTYHSFDLSLGRPLASFTNHYHREQGLGIDLSTDVSVVASVAGWATVVRVM